jgi:HSP20 family molecular chaperone IbpA
VGFLKRLLGTTDAVEDARERAGDQEAAQPAGWNLTSPEVTQTEDGVTLKMAAPGLDPTTLETQVDGDALVLKARGETGPHSTITLNERLQLKGAGDLAQANVSYEDGQIVVRIPKSALPAKPAEG